MDTIKDMAYDIANLIDDKKGLDIRILEVKGLCSLADYFVIATGTSSTHIKAIANSVEKEMAERGIHTAHKEGQRGDHWILLDFLDVVVHVFSAKERDFYDLERIWSDAKKLDLHIQQFSS